MKTFILISLSLIGLMAQSQESDPMNQSIPNNLYPHLYRIFNKEDMIAHFTVNRNENGQFEIPKQLQPKIQK